MSAHRARSVDSWALGSVGRGAIAEVMTMERAVKSALAPIATAARARGVDLFCEITQAVGEFVLGERHELKVLIARAAASATAAAVGGVVCVRVARQHAGFEATDRVLVSVSTRHGDKVEDAEAFDLALPIAKYANDLPVVRELAGSRVLLVVPGAHLGVVQRVAIRRFGAVVESVPDVDQARERMRSLALAGERVDVVYLDDQAARVTDFLEEMRDDASLGGARALVGTALASGPLRDAYSTSGAARTLSKPVLPFEMRDTILQLGAADAPAATDAEPPISTVVPVRRPSGMRRRARLAEVLASVAVGPEPSGR